MIRLVSLLEDPAFELAYLGKGRGPEGARYVVRRTAWFAGNELFFDEKTGFLVKTELLSSFRENRIFKRRGIPIP